MSKIEPKEFVPVLTVLVEPGPAYIWIVRFFLTTTLAVWLGVNPK